MDPDELEEFATLGKEICDNGIEVRLNPGDLKKVFAAVIAANVVTYVAFNTPNFIRTIRLKRDVEELQQRAERKNKKK